LEYCDAPLEYRDRALEHYDAPLRFQRVALERAGKALRTATSPASPGLRLR